MHVFNHGAICNDYYLKRTSVRSRVVGDAIVAQGGEHSHGVRRRPSGTLARIG